MSEPIYKRPHHQRILRLLQTLDSGLLSKCRCYFGGGTAIVLALDEYRESLDVDFLCASQEGYRKLRGIAFNHGIEGFFRTAPQPLREPRTDQYGIRAFLRVDNTPIRFEIVREAHISLSGRVAKELNVPRLTRTDLFASKLLANADRYADIGSADRDIIDLAMMVSRWGRIPRDAWDKTRAAYGDMVVKACEKAIERIRKPEQIKTSMEKLKMDIDLMPTLLATLQKFRSTIPFDHE